MDVQFAGVPVSLLYLFGVWAFLIAVAVLLAGPLRRSDRSSSSADSTSREA